MTKPTTVVESIKTYDAKLDQVRLARKYRLMRQDPFAFYRAVCHLFYEHLPKLGRLLHSPPAWSCGDLHLENFGTFRGEDGSVYFEINDFDESLLAPCAVDVLRGCASIAAARDKLALSSAQEKQVMAVFVESYAKALARGRARFIERDQASGQIGEMVRQLRGGSRKALLDKRTLRDGGSWRINADDEHAFEATEGEKARVAGLLRRWAAGSEEARAKPPEFFEIIDVANRIAGLGSLGVERYIVLVKGGGPPDDMRLIDVKRARPSCAAAVSRTRQPDWSSEAERMAEVQSRMQVNSPAFLGAVVERGRSYVIRELQPREDRLDLRGLAKDEARCEAAIAAFAQLTAWAHLRSAGRQGSAKVDDLIEFGHKTKWRDRLMLAAQHCAARSRADWEIFCQAYDQGAFSPGSSNHH